MPISTDMVKLEGFRDELVKIAMKGRLGAAASRGVELLSGGKRQDIGFLGRLGEKITGNKVIGERTGALKNLKSGDKALKSEAMKTLATRGAAGVAGTAAVAAGTKKHRKTERQQLGRAYVAGARDMYSRTRQ